MRRSRPAFILASLAMLLAAGVPARAAAPSADKKEIVIGMTVSTTGSFAYASESGVKGIDIWVKEVNDAGGIMVKEYGKKLTVRLVKLEDRSDKQLVPRLYERLINEDKVDIAMAPFGSTLTGAAAPITEKYKKTLVGWSAASDTIYEQGFQYAFSAAQQAASAYCQPQVAHAKSLGVQRMAIIYLDQPFTESTANCVKSATEKAGMKVVHFEKYPTGTKDFTAMLRKVKAQNPDGFHVGGYIEEQTNVVRQLKETNQMYPWIFMQYSAQPEWEKLTGNDGLYLFGSTMHHPQLKHKVTAGMDITQFIKAHDTMFPNAKNPADFQTNLAYGSSVVLQKVIEHAGSLDATALKKAAVELSGKMTVVTGHYILEESGKQLGMSSSITQTVKKDGKYHLNLVYPENVATSKAIFPIPAWDKR